MLLGGTQPAATSVRRIKREPLVAAVQAKEQFFTYALNRAMSVLAPVLDLQIVGSTGQNSIGLNGLVFMHGSGPIWKKVTIESQR